MKEADGLRPINRMQPAFHRPSSTKLRLIDAHSAIVAGSSQDVLYQHTIFCQTSLPYRDPGELRMVERRNGAVALQVIAGEAMHPVEQRFVPVGLPWGTKPRLILADINTQAILTQKPEIDLEASLTRYVKRMNLATHGRNIRAIKDALARLCASSIRIGLVHDGCATTINAHVMTSFDIWFPKDMNQRVLWPSTAKLSQEYFESLMSHGVPLREDALVALSHSAMAMDVYAWLAQRLHRVPKGHSSLIPWPALHSQFGWHYERLRRFRQAFNVALRQVVQVYPEAKIEVNERGMWLRNSRPPISKQRILLP